MDQTEKLTLIEGKFLNEEAKDILTNIFISKINFHHLKNFSSIERFGKDDETAQKRIPELNKELIKLQEILSEAKAENKKLVVQAVVKISLADN